jgi:hypothetical protein
MYSQRTIPFLCFVLLLSCGAPPPAQDDPNAIVAISAGSGLTPSVCGVTRSGAVRCRSANSYEVWAPVAANAVSVASVDTSGCAINADQTMNCWTDASQTAGVRGWVTFDSTLTNVTSVAVGVDLLFGGRTPFACAVIGSTSRECFYFQNQGDLMVVADRGLERPPLNSEPFSTKIHLEYLATSKVTAGGIAVMNTAEGGGQIYGAQSASGRMGYYCAHLRTGENACGDHDRNPTVNPALAGLTELQVALGSCVGSPPIET